MSTIVFYMFLNFRRFTRAYKYQEQSYAPMNWVGILKYFSANRLLSYLSCYDFVISIIVGSLKSPGPNKNSHEGENQRRQKKF